MSTCVNLSPEYRNGLQVGLQKLQGGGCLFKLGVHERQRENVKSKFSLLLDYTANNSLRYKQEVC